MAMRSDGLETRQRLIEAAMDVFSSKGFRNTTVAEICDLAGANVAAVNYHFGGKEQLYAAVWRHAFEEMEQAYPMDEARDLSLSPRKRLHALIRTVLSRILRHGPQSRSGQLLLQELSQPNEAIDTVRHEVTQSARNCAFKIMAELIGTNATDMQIRMCIMSVMHQVLAIGFLGGRKPPAYPDRGRFNEHELDELIEHIYQFSLGGVLRIRKLTGKTQK